MLLLKFYGYLLNIVLELMVFLKHGKKLKDVFERKY